MFGTRIYTDELIKEAPHHYDDITWFNFNPNIDK